MRIGTTSYIVPADIITNARWLAGKVQDVELVIFESDEAGSNLPDRATIDELIRIGTEHDLTYTVHLPLDLSLADSERSIGIAAKVIETTRPLGPVGYVVHLDGNAEPGSEELRRWTDRCCGCLVRLGEAAGSLHLLCVENLDDQLPLMLDTVLERMPVSCCIDIGHLWKNGRDPIPCLEAWLPRSRVVHIHGVGTRDHKALSLMAEDVLDPVVEKLSNGFHGVVTLEVFSQEDFEQSFSALHGAIRRVSGIASHP
jgi:sugar phosphate isomerase/epimerase